MRRADIDATSRVVERLFHVQDKFGLSDKQILVGIIGWLVEVGLQSGEEMDRHYPSYREAEDGSGRDSNVDIAELQTERDELLYLLAAIVQLHGGSMSVSEKDFTAAPVSRLVRQYRLDASGVDCYFSEEPKLK